MSHFTGTGTLIRFILRRDRIRLPIWTIGFLITAVGTASIFPDTYPTEADRQARATLMENPALRMLVGPAHGLDDYTFGAMMASEMLGMMAIVIALMSIFMVVRHTRAEEESGRAELVRSSIVGRYAGLAAALVVVTATNLLIAGLVALGLYYTLVELDLAGSIVFGAGMAVAGISFAAIAAVSVQINEFSRAASGMSIAVLGVSYAVRGFGDMLENALSWVPPFGLILQSAPYVHDRWWALGVALLIAVALIPVAFTLITRRDVAAGLRAPGAGPSHASAFLRQPFGLVLRLQRGSLIAWSAGLGAFGLMYGGATSEIGDMYATNPMVVEYFTALGLDIDQITESVIAMFVMFFGMLASIFAVSAVARLRTEETSLRAENVLATAVSRIRWAGESLVFGLVASSFVLLAAGTGAGLMFALDTGSLSNFYTVLGASLVYVPALWLASAVAIAVFGLVPRAMALAWFIPAYGFFALMIGPLLGLPSWLYNLSPFEYVPRVPSVEFDIIPLLVMTAVALVLIILGLAGFRRRDLELT